jgi:hypothetical protein
MTGSYQLGAAYLASQCNTIYTDSGKGQRYKLGTAVDPAARCLLYIILEVRGPPPDAAAPRRPRGLLRALLTSGCCLALFPGRPEQPVNILQAGVAWLPGVVIWVLLHVRWHIQGRVLGFWIPWVWGLYIQGSVLGGRLLWVGSLYILPLKEPVPCPADPVGYLPVLADLETVVVYHTCSTPAQDPVQHWGLHLNHQQGALPGWLQLAALPVLGG